MYLWTRKLPLNFGSHADLVPDRRIFEVILPLWQKGENLATFIDNSGRCLRIHTKFSFLKIINFVRICLTGNKRFDFGADSNHNPDTRIFVTTALLQYLEDELPSLEQICAPSAPVNFMQLLHPPRMSCFYPCLSVCLSVSRIIPKFVDECW